MKKLFVFVFVCCLIGKAEAQFVADYLKAADRYFEKGDYASAAEYYEKYFGDGKAQATEFNPYSPQRSSKKTVSDASSQDHARYNLAESYRLLNFPSKAEPHYKVIVETKSQAFPLARFHYASQLRALGNYPEAESQFRTFLNEYSTADNYRKDADRELKNLQFVQQQLTRKDLKYYKVNKAPADVNSAGANYAAAWLNNSTVLFTSTRPDDVNDKGAKYVNRVYQANYSNDAFSSIQRTAVKQDEKLEQGVVAVTPDGNTMYVTRWVGNSKDKSATLYRSNKSDNGWTDPVKLGDMINAPGANTQQPFVSPDGKFLLFSSNRQGGKGGYDIWYVPVGDESSAPVNLSAINTEYDEQSPFYHNASNSLVFASNGRVGMGGYDLFVSKGAINGALSEPTNFGHPVNSVKDDLYFTSNGPANNILGNVLMSSDREAACCLELFYVSKFRPLRQVSGRIVSCNPDKPLTGATVSITDINGKVIHTQQVSADGNYSFTIEDYMPLKVEAQSSGFITNSIRTGTPADMEEETFAYPDLCLVPEPPKVNETFVVENVYYDFDKADLKPESFPALDEIVRMLNFYPNMVIELSAHTDSKGSDSYNLRLSDARARSVVAYLVSKGIDASRLVAKGYGESMPIAENTVDGKDNPAGREKNRRTEFKVLKNE